jgi:hypothetical protein
MRVLLRMYLMKLSAVEESDLLIIPLFPFINKDQKEIDIECRLREFEFRRKFNSLSHNVLQLQ